jgi:hypothetical protein
MASRGLRELSLTKTTPIVGRNADRFADVRRALYIFPMKSHVNSFRFQSLSFLYLSWLGLLHDTDQEYGLYKKQLMDF